MFVWTPCAYLVHGDQKKNVKSPVTGVTVNLNHLAGARN